MIGELKQTTSRLAIGAATGLFMGGIALTPVQAASLGGDCCADLEERVAELEATTVRKGNRKVSVKLSGQVSRAILYWDDGKDTNTYFVDNSNSNTRFRITGSGHISPGRTAGFRIEADWFTQDNSSKVSNCMGASKSASGQHCMALPHTSEQDMRYQDLWIKDERLGKISLGKGDSASENMAHVDLSGTSIAQYAGHDQGSDFQFRTKGGSYSGITLDAAYSDYDGRGRATRIRYDTPSIGGFTFSVSTGADDFVDGAVRFKKEWNSVRCAGVLASMHNTEVKNEDFWFTGGSGSCIHTPSGLNLTIGYIENDKERSARRDGKWAFVKAGISRRWNSHGKTSISGQYAETKDNIVGTSGKAKDWGVAVVQNIDSAAMELYIAYNSMEYSDSSAYNFEDLEFLMTGARIKF